MPGTEEIVRNQKERLINLTIRNAGSNRFSLASPFIAKMLFVKKNTILISDQF